MKIIEILLIGIGLAMDAFTVSICKGLSIKKISFKKSIIIGLYFSIFQGLMPLIGYLIGKKFFNIVLLIDHWIALIILSMIGINMIIESFSKKEKEVNDKIDFKTMIPLSIATSIDALTVGITFAFLKVNIIVSIIIISIITLIITTIGVIIGHKFGTNYQKQSQFLGGLILIMIGVKTLIEHLST